MHFINYNPGLFLHHVLYPIFVCIHLSDIIIVAAIPNDVPAQSVAERKECISPRWNIGEMVVVRPDAASGDLFWLALVVCNESQEHVKVHWHRYVYFLFIILI